MVRAGGWLRTVEGLGNERSAPLHPWNVDSPPALAALLQASMEFLANQAPALTMVQKALLK